MIPTHTCIICGTPRLERKAGRIAPFIAHRCGIDPSLPINRLWCPECDLLFYDQRLDEEEVRRLYLDYRGEDYVRERTRFEPDYPGKHLGAVDSQDTMHQMRILGLATEFSFLNRPLGRVLDYGGGDGWLTRKAFPAGEIVVYDLADGADVPPESGFDPVICAHVLEHVSFPIPFLQNLLTHMHPQGVLYLEVPGPGRMPPASSVFDYMGPVMHEHVSFFSGRAILRLLYRCGLQPVQFGAYPEVTKVFAGHPAFHPYAVREERLRSGWLPPPIRGAQGTDTCGVG